MQKIVVVLCIVFNQIGGWFQEASGFANFCTIILFCLFVIGKIWILIRNRTLYNENFEYMVVDKDLEFNRQFLLGEQEVIKISSPDGIYDINIYSLHYTKTGKIKKIPITIEMEDNIQHPLKLNKNEAVHIRVDLPCGVPNYQVEIIKYDYVKIVAKLGSNGKVGGVSVDTHIKYGLRSFLYYLCQ